MAVAFDSGDLIGSLARQVHPLTIEKSAKHAKIVSSVPSPAQRLAVIVSRMKDDNRTYLRQRPEKRCWTKTDNEVVRESQLGGEAGLRCLLPDTTGRRAASFVLVCNLLHDVNDSCEGKTKAGNPNISKVAGNPTLAYVASKTSP